MLAAGCALALGCLRPQRPAGRRRGGCRSPPAARAASTRSTAAAWPRCSPPTGTRRRPRRRRRRSTTCSCVADGDSDVAFSLADTAIDAVKGQDAFEQPLPLRALGTLYSNFTHVVALKDSGIETIEDLRGKTVSIGAPNSGTEVIGRRLMEVAGVDPDADVTRRAMGVGESAAALREGSIDAFVWSGGLPTGAITDLATTDEIVLLPLDRYVAKLNERYGEAYSESEVEEGEYPGVPAVKTIAVPNLLMVRADMPEPLAHDVIALMFAHKAELGRGPPVGREARARTTRRSSSTGVELHPGAAALLPRRRRRSEAAAPRARALGARSPAGVRCSAEPRVVARDGDGGVVVAEAPLPADGHFALSYRHSVYRAPATERFRATGDGFVLESVASPSADVIDYYALDGTRTREGGDVGHDARASPRASRRWRWPRPGAGGARSSPARAGPALRPRGPSAARRWSGHDRRDHRRGPRRVRGRAARAQARRASRRGWSRCSAPG